MISFTFNLYINYCGVRSTTPNALRTSNRMMGKKIARMPMMATGSLKADLPAFSRSDTQYSSGSFSRVSFGRSSPESPRALVLVDRAEANLAGRASWLCASEEEDTGRDCATGRAIDSVRIVTVVWIYGDMMCAMDVVLSRWRTDELRTRNTKFSFVETRGAAEGCPHARRVDS